MAKRKSIADRAKNYERWIGFAIGGSRVYGQSAKHYIKDADGEDIGGDAKNDFVLGECKSYDPAAGTKWRKENPRLPAKSFRIEMKWVNQIRDEAAAVAKHPFLAFNNKFDPLIESHIVISLDFFLRLLYAVGWGKFSNVYEAWSAWKIRSATRAEEEDNGDTGL